VVVFSFQRLVLMFGADIKLAESLSLAVSLSTMIVGSRALAETQLFGHAPKSGVPDVMVAGSLVGTFVGGHC